MNYADKLFGKNKLWLASSLNGLLFLVTDVHTFCDGRTHLISSFKSIMTNVRDGRTVLVYVHHNLSGVASKLMLE